MIEMRPSHQPTSLERAPKPQSIEPALRRILVADDDPTTSALLDSSSELEGYVVVRAGNGREAYDKRSAGRA